VLNYQKAGSLWKNSHQNRHGLFETFDLSFVQRDEK